MQSVNELIDDVLVREGGCVDHPNDRGGPTNYGITQKTLSNYLGFAASRDDVLHLSEEVAREIYTKNYFYSPGINRLPESIQPFIFDSAVNHGPRRALKFVQRVCNQAGYQPALQVDGAIGPNTLRGISWTAKEMGELFLKALVEERRNFYYTIVEHRPSQKVFLQGWLNRVDEFEQEVA